jgi:hypothetical protein
VNTDNLGIAFLLAGALLALNITGVLAQSGSGQQMHGTHGTVPMGHAAMPNEGIPALPGQGAFGAIQEIITLLEADPATDWSRVNIAALRAHLVDMNRLVMESELRTNVIDGGLEMHVTGRGGALRAIRSMVPAHAPMIDGLNGWVAGAEKTTTGASLTVTSTDPKEVAHIRGLGFYGLMATGGHHQTHHLGLARGEKIHTQ